MGHYDNCRPENCSICGQAIGYCEHTSAKAEVYIPPKKEKSMFRGTKKSEMSPKNFGAGSIIKEGNFQEYLVVSSSTQKEVILVDMKTFTILSYTTVDDPNFLSVEEVRTVIKPLRGTFTDYDFDAKGLKK